MTPDEHRTEAERLLEEAAVRYGDITDHEDTEANRASIADAQTLGILAIGHALLAGPASPWTPGPPSHVPTNEVVDYPGT